VTRSADDTPLLAARLCAQLLSGAPASGPVAVAERLLAVQGQDPRGVRLAIRARTRGLTVASVERALTDERTLVISWLCRGTLHLVRREDYPWLHALTGHRQVGPTSRRLAQLDVSPTAAERGVAAIERSLASEGPLTREQLRARLDRARVPTAGQTLIHLLGLAAARGLIVRAPMVGVHQAYVLVRDWLGAQPAVDRDRALAELARRYLAGHGPAGDRDLARWAGLPLRDARSGLAAIASGLRERGDGLLDLAGRRDATGMPPPRLLGAFDPVLLGWSSREAILGRHAGAVVGSGLFRPIALVGGRAVGIWALRAGSVSLEPFARVRRADAAALELDARDVTRYLATA
jgi:hypothetical protein